MKTKSILIILLFLTTINLINAQDVKVKVGDVKDSRTTGEFFAGLEIDLKFIGDILENAQSIKCTINKAIDETGRDLIKENERVTDYLEIDKDNPGRVDVTIKLKNPSRKSMTVKELDGEVEVYIPKLDPNSTITIKNFVSQSGKLITNPALKSSNIRISILTSEQYASAKEQKKSEIDTSSLVGQMVDALSNLFGGLSEPGINSIILQLTDPDGKIIDVEFLDADGRNISPQGTTTMSDIYMYDFESALPGTTQLKLYLTTDKALKFINFTLKDIDLP